MAPKLDESCGPRAPQPLNTCAVAPHEADVGALDVSRRNWSSLMQADIEAWCGETGA